MDFAELPLPNAKIWLFGDEFPSMASKQAELSRGLTKKLVQQAPNLFPKRTTSSLFKGKYRGYNFF